MSSLTLEKRRLFVAGATGATGRTLLPLAAELGIDLIPHLRLATAERLGEAAPARSAALDLSDTPSLRAALADRTTLVQLIGSTKKRFSQGDTYESSDIGTTRSLVAAVRGTDVDHLVLLSSVGAGKPTGAYLKAKAAAERIVTESGIDWTIFRPSAFIGAGHGLPWGVPGLMRALAPQRYHPIAIEDLARALLYVAGSRSHLGEVLEGPTLWATVAEARQDR
jgi:uncharacterized protein YbjT (DUF2867 family)